MTMPMATMCATCRWRQKIADAAIRPVSFAMVLDTLSRALEGLPDPRRRRVAGILLHRLRGRLDAVASLTGQMLEALLVTFEPLDTAEADLSWAAYWWDIVAAHFLVTSDVLQTLADSHPSDLEGQVGAGTDAPEASGMASGAVNAVNVADAAASDCNNPSTDALCPALEVPFSPVHPGALPSASAGVALVGPTVPLRRPRPLRLSWW